MSMREVEVLLARWAKSAERFWYPIPGSRGRGCYGSGYNTWGVQTNQKYISALGTLAVSNSDVPGIDRQWALERALAALRFSLDSHLSATGCCTDGSQWGHTWISGLGIERMMHAVYSLNPYLADEDREAVGRVLVSEAEWLLLDYRKGQVTGIAAHPWDHTGKNQPESNIWNGALLWRTAMMYPDHPHAADWQERAHLFLLNGVSLASDALDDRMLAGKPIRERHVGANFFPNFALDHHGYLNVGYMAICLSNAAMLHFDMKKQGMPRPETLDHHQRDLWNLIKRLTFQGGRLARIGGDTRVRYAYCQDYLLPSLLYAADRFGDSHALELAQGQLRLIQQEAEQNPDGSFYGCRLRELEKNSPYYYTRLESDRSCALAQYLTYQPMVQHLPAADVSFETAVKGGWNEPDHGAVLQRSPKRLASFAWRAHGLAQGMCQPPDQPHLVDWEGNLCGKIEFLNHFYPDHPSRLQHRRLVSYNLSCFHGGFITSGAIIEGAEVEMVEGWRGKDMALHQVVFAALPDDQTVIGMEFCQINQARGCLREVKGLHFNLANDLYNDYRNAVEVESGRLVLESPAAGEEWLHTGSRWLNTSGCLGVVGIYGSQELVIHRVPRRRGGSLASLYVDEICWEARPGPFWADAEEVVLDVGWAVLSGADAISTRSFSLQAGAVQQRIDISAPGSSGNLALVRAVRITGGDAKSYVLVANFGKLPCDIPTQWIDPKAAWLENLVDGVKLPKSETVELNPGCGMVYRSFG